LFSSTRLVVEQQPLRSTVDKIIYWTRFAAYWPRCGYWEENLKPWTGATASRYNLSLIQPRDGCCSDSYPSSVPIARV